MLDAVDLSLTLKKKVYKSVRNAQIDRIFDLSELVYERKRPVMIVFEGWDASGKGTTIRQLTAPLDARGFKVLATQAPRTHETRKPWLWRFWMNIPRYGQIALFDRSWYGRVLIERVNGLTPMPQWIAAYEEINNFERTLADDGTVFIKFWLHISKDEQLRRFMQLALEPETAWRVTAEDWENHRRYEEYLAAVRDMLKKTHTPIAPWTVIPSHDADVRLFCVFDTIIARLEAALDVTRSEWPALDELADAPDARQRKEQKQAEKDKKEKRTKKPKEGKLENAEVKPDSETGKAKEKKSKKKKKTDGVDIAPTAEMDHLTEERTQEETKGKIAQANTALVPEVAEAVSADAPAPRRKRAPATPSSVTNKAPEA